MSKFIERMSGKAEEQLNAKLAEAEKRIAEAENRIAELMSQLEAANSELTTAKNTLQNTQRELYDSTNRLSSRCNELTKLWDDEKKAHAVDLQENDKKVSDLQDHIKKLEAKCSAMVRSVEISEPANAIADAELPTLEYFTNHRNEVYSEYCRAQEHAIKECIQKAAATGEVPTLNLTEDPSFTFTTPSGQEFTFVSLELLEKLYKSTRYVAGLVLCTNTAKHEFDLFDLTTGYCGLYDRCDFPRSQSVNSEYGEALTIIRVSEYSCKEYDRFMLTFKMIS